MRIEVGRGLEGALTDAQSKHVLQDVMAPHFRQGVLLPTAYFTGETFKPASRDPLSTIVHHDRW